MLVRPRQSVLLSMDHSDSEAALSLGRKRVATDPPTIKDSAPQRRRGRTDFGTDIVDCTVVPIQHGGAMVG